MLKAKDADVAGDYLPLIEAYLSGQRSIEEFRRDYWAKCQSNDRMFSDAMKEIIWSLQTELDFLQIDPQLRADLNAAEQAKLPVNPQYYSIKELQLQKNKQPDNH